MIKKGHRGVGYCSNFDCVNFMKGVFIFLHKDSTLFECGQCNTKFETIIQEQMIFPDETPLLWKRVKVEFDYDPIHKKYTKIFIVEDDDMPDIMGEVTYQHPCVKTETRAEKIAEWLFCNLIVYSDKKNLFKGVPENILSLDDSTDQFKHDLHRLEMNWNDTLQLQNMDYIKERLGEHG